MTPSEQGILNTLKLMAYPSEQEIKKAQRRMLLKALEDLYNNIEEEGLSTLTLYLNYNPYNMGHKIEKVYQIGYERNKVTSNGESS